MRSIKNPLLFATLATLLFLVSACNNDKPDTPETPVDVPATKAYKVPAFNADSAYVYVKKQVEFGSRLVNTPGHTATKEWLVGQLKGYGLDVIEQDFQATAYTGTVLNSTNIIGRYNPDAKKRIVLAAHWDTRHIADSPINTDRVDEPILGADDGGSGVGVLLEIARMLQANPIDAKDLGVDIIFFDAEDHGNSGGDHRSYCLGAQHWAKNPHVANYKPRYGILLDMVGAAGARFTKERVSMSYAPDVMNKVWRLAQGMGHGNLFVDIPTTELVDDHFFVNTIAGIPMIDIINRPATTETGFPAHWHTHNDTMDIIDRGTLRAVGQVLGAVVYREASGTF
ncbi:MAG: M28 family peptidase [Saprospirales bacterium]|nr:M28 family peptidase [Saprospirales bacterium]